MPLNNALSTPNRQPLELRVGIDIGGTFTDFVYFNVQAQTLDTFKLPSTPSAPDQAVILGLRMLAARLAVDGTPPILAVVHGSTVATNALLEYKGAKTALVTTEGFRDVLQIGRQNRPDLYDLFPASPSPLVPGELRLEIHERVDATGEVLLPLTQAEIKRVTTALQNVPAPGVESVAVVLLFSFIKPEHEATLAESLRAAGFFVSVSHEIIPEFREYERTATTVVNAYVSPVMDRYLQRLEEELPEVQVRVMQSNGGSISIAQARRQAVRCILSGPAGGVVASYRLGRMRAALAGEAFPDLAELGSGGIITFDMGGTSTDVAMVENLQEDPHTTTEAVIGGLPIRVPVLDIHTIGAGGGSIAAVDAGGVLRVGPQSAGAEPGPACYGRTPPGQPLVPTVTDANLVLGRIDPETFLGGAMRLYPDLASQAVARLAGQLNLPVVDTALGIIAIANAHMERALRVISVERGHDPRLCTLVSFGGAGGLHAADLARRSGIPWVLVSPFASTFSALGMLMADVVKDYTQTVMFQGSVPGPILEAAFAPLLQQGAHDLTLEGVDPQDSVLETWLDVRYTGQAYEITLPYTPAWEETFAALHERQYGYRATGLPLQVVNVRVRAVGRMPHPELLPAGLSGTDPSGAFLDDLQVVLPDGQQHVRRYLGEKLQPSNRIAGPALILRPDTTILVGKTDHAFVDPLYNVFIRIGL